MEEYEEAEFDPTQSSEVTNLARMMNHVMQKGWQAGSVVGLGLVAPIICVRFYRKTGSLAAPELGLRLASAQGTAALAGVALSTVLGAVRIAGYEERKAALEDRAYRLHHNHGQNRVDRFAQVGTVIGATFASLALGSAAVVGGASAGAGLGVLAHVATMKREAP